MKKCPYCAELIQDEAIVCRYCRRDLPRGETKIQKPMFENPRTPKIIKIGCVIVIVLVVLSGVIISLMPPLDDDAPESVSQSRAKMECQDYVEAVLIAPSTAKFQSYFYQKIWTLGKESGKYENAFRVESYVDSQNSFGAQVRNYYTCDVNFTNDKWELLDLDIY